MPPRSLKSHCASVAFPAWLLGKRPSEKIIAVSYGQELADKHARDSRRVIMSPWYERAFATRLSSARPPTSDFSTTANGFRLSSSIGGALTGRGANFMIIDDPLKPEDALSDTQRKAVNESFAHTLLSRLNNKETGCIIVIMQRLHEEDLVGYLLAQGGWKLLRFPAIAETDEVYEISSLTGRRTFKRLAGEVLHPEHESLATVQAIRKTVGEYHFAGQYQQSPAPLGGGMVKREWLKYYGSSEHPERWAFIFQSWDTANKPNELNDHSVCTTWGVKDRNLYLLSVFRDRLDYPMLKRAVREQANRFSPRTILIEDRASGTQLIQELLHERLHAIKSYKPTLDKVMRLYSVCSTFENGFVHLPATATWLDAYIYELMTFPKGRHDDQVDSTSQALDWFKQQYLAPRVTCTYFPL